MTGTNRVSRRYIAVRRIVRVEACDLIDKYYDVFINYQTYLRKNRLLCKAEMYHGTHESCMAYVRCHDKENTGDKRSSLPRKLFSLCFGVSSIHRLDVSRSMNK